MSAGGPHTSDEKYAKIFASVDIGGRAVRYVWRRSLLKLRLKEHKLTQKYVCERTGIDKRQMSRYANNKAVPEWEIALSIADVIGCHPRDLGEWDIIIFEAEK